jgi:hypothetical protein
MTLSNVTGYFAIYMLWVSNDILISTEGVKNVLLRSYRICYDAYSCVCWCAGYGVLCNLLLDVLEDSPQLMVRSIWWSHVQNEHRVVTAQHFYFVSIHCIIEPWQCKQCYKYFGKAHVCKLQSMCINHWTPLHYAGILLPVIFIWICIKQGVKHNC